MAARKKKPAPQALTYLCVRTCQYKGRLWQAGQVLQAVPGETPPGHFRPGNLAEQAPGAGEE